MKTHYYLILALAAAAVCRSRAGSSPAAEWGPVTNGIQLSIALRQSEKQKESDLPGDLMVRTRNVLSNESICVVLYGGTLGEYSFQIRSPSGRDLSQKQRPYTPSAARSTVHVKPNEVYSHPAIDLRTVCDLSEAGLYSIIVKQKVLGPGGLIEATSNPLTFTLKTAASRKPPALTNGFGGFGMLGH